MTVEKNGFITDKNKEDSFTIFTILVNGKTYNCN